MTGRLLLICEDREDSNVIQALIYAKGYKTKVEWQRLTGGSGGIDRLKEQLIDLLTVVIKKRTKRDCVAVFHDADIQTHPLKKQKIHDEIDRICQSDQYKADVYLIVPKDELESWLLADEGFCKWLSDKKAENWDGQPNPSKELNRRHKDKTGHDFGGVYRQKALPHLNGTGEKLSPSLAKALRLLKDAPCTRP